MRFNSKFVIAALVAVIAHALPIYNINAQRRSTRFKSRASTQPSVTNVPQFCQDNLDTSKPVSVKDLKQCLKNQNDVAGKSFFFVNPHKPLDKIDYLKEAVKWRGGNANLNDLMILDDFWLTPAVKTWAYAQAKRYTDAGKRQRTMFWTPASRAMAELSSGIVRVIIPENVDPVTKPANVKQFIVWYDVECPVLAKNTKVTEVYKVFPGSKDKAVKVDYKSC